MAELIVATVPAFTSVSDTNASTEMTASCAMVYWRVANRIRRKHAAAIADDSLMP
jgi:hypothetical protein